MKIRHRIPPEAHFVSDPVTPEYQAEVDATVARAEKRERDARRRLDAAQRKLAKIEQRHGAKSKVRAVLVARELVEIRRQELLAIQRAMQAAPAASSNRGLGHKKRAAPTMHTL
ncbi:MAG TPA: hypothetical protein VFH80_23635 [Solirubrobacteraceae bacterium]|nr:hypothetical protein [Solirubrobacteraceae bacterium]